MDGKEGDPFRERQYTSRPVTVKLYIEKGAAPYGTGSGEENDMGKTLVAYFSASGVTAKVARELAASMGADLFEIRPETPYSPADLRWQNPMSRCNREKFGKKDVPIAGRAEGFEQYGAVLIGFPIWYYCAPNVVNTFCKAYDWSGKKVFLFATSGGSGMGKSAEKLAPCVPGAEFRGEARLKKPEDAEGWLETLPLGKGE